MFSKTLGRYALGALLTLSMLLPVGGAAATEISPEAEFSLEVIKQTQRFDESWDAFELALDELKKPDVGNEQFSALLQEVYVWGDISDRTKETTYPTTCAAAGEAYLAWGSELGVLESKLTDWFYETGSSELAFRKQQGAVDKARTVLEQEMLPCFELAGIDPPDATATNDTEGKAVRGQTRPTDASQTTKSPSNTTGDQSYSFPVGDIVITVSDDFTIADPAESSSPDQILLQHESGRASVSVMDGGKMFPPDRIRDIYVSGFGRSVDLIETIATDDNENSSTGLYRVELNGTEIMTYVRVTQIEESGILIIESVLAPPESFEDAMMALQEGVEVDGVPMFDGENAEELMTAYEEYVP